MKPDSASLSPVATSGSENSHEQEASRTGSVVAADTFVQQSVIAVPKLSLEQGRMPEDCCQNAISMVPAAPAARKSGSQSAIWQYIQFLAECAFGSV